MKRGLRPKLSPLAGRNEAAPHSASLCSGAFPRRSHCGRPAVPPQANYSNGGVFWLIYCITFWLLLSYMVPLSLFVTMEIVKLFQVRPGRRHLGLRV